MSCHLHLNYIDWIKDGILALQDTIFNQYGLILQLNIFIQVKFYILSATSRIFLFQNLTDRTKEKSVLTYTSVSLFCYNFLFINSY